MKETCVEFVSGQSYLTWCSGEQKFINRIRKLHATYPESVEIIAENLDGSIMVRTPVNWFRPPQPKTKRRPMSDEERLSASFRLSEARNKKTLLNKQRMS